MSVQDFERPKMELGNVYIRDAREQDYAAILTYNAADVEMLSPLDDADALKRLVAHADAFWVAEVDGQVAGFLVAMREGSGYWSSNYSWFQERYDRFLYVDRIVVGQEFRGHGIARAFYTALTERAKTADAPRITAEIDIEPVYNAASMAFHASKGFAEVGQKPYGDVTVSLQVLELDD